MAKNNSRVLLNTKFSVVDDLERLLLPAWQTSPTSWRNDRNEITDQSARPPTTVENSGEDLFQAVADQVVPKERPAYLEASSVIRLMTDRILDRDEVVGISVHVEKTLAKLLTHRPTANKNAENQVSALLKKLVFRALDKNINTTEALKRTACL